MENENYNQLGRLYGYAVIVNDHCEGEYYYRTWTERLFSRPWKPWRKKVWDWNLGEKVIKNGKVIADRSTRTIIVNSETLKCITGAIDEIQ